ncbi:polymer-forming cytoskeletal protein [Ketobacter sp. MCCC 1A13808]|uniref:bactofilin family protein n=1 Tax=Ketobacter sp. MCCC 1A13808 TaxID=2602738 RepID=UPI000F1C0655|nr:polymer-forming cytoskeletal protein [Ketobacter sp. MCCC 1A13808]MVF12961.1 polymer-forming cytoskeletal protein [Ketobacter sp. MCCC 1A13808]RLP53810.1 MAG: polymer-forming cytoskeletal protein [Ketobacter sp.]
MWGKDKGKKVDFDRHAGKTTMISKGTVVDGDVKFEGGLLVEGTIKGNVRADEGSEALLRLSEAGQIEGEIHVPNVVINGKVNGDVHSTTHVELAAKAEVNGNVHYNLIEMVMGAAVNGSLVHNQPKQAATDVSLSLEKKSKAGSAAKSNAEPELDPKHSHAS